MFYKPCHFVFIVNNILKTKNLFKFIILSLVTTSFLGLNLSSFANLKINKRQIDSSKIETKGIIINGTVSYTSFDKPYRFIPPNYKNIFCSNIKVNLWRAINDDTYRGSWGNWKVKSVASVKTSGNLQQDGFCSYQMRVSEIVFKNLPVSRHNYLQASDSGKTTSKSSRIILSEVKPIISGGILVLYWKK